MLLCGLLGYSGWLLWYLGWFPRVLLGKLLVVTDRYYGVLKSS